MSNLQTLIDLGIRTLQVTNHLATAVNPYQSPDGIVKWAEAQFLPPLRTFNIPNGDINIEEVEEEKQFLDEDIDGNDIWIKCGCLDYDYFKTRFALVKKQVKEEEPNKSGSTSFAKLDTSNIGPTASDKPLTNPILRRKAHGMDVKTFLVKRLEMSTYQAENLYEDYILATKEYADSQLAQYKARLIVELEAERKKERKPYNTDYVENGLKLAISLIENS